VKACGELALAALLGGVVLNGAADRVGALDAALRAHMTAAWSLRLTDLLARAATARNVALTAGALVLDGALTLCEGWVLYRGLTWGPWLVVITTGIAPAVRGGRARTPSASGPVADPRRESRHRLVPGGASRTASPDAPA